jgi:DNA polymerase-3 subunit delta
MTPQQFQAKVARGLAPAYLFLGPDVFWRDRCRAALIEAALPDPAERAEGLTRVDLSEVSLADVADDARSLSLFAARRLIVAASAEAALPRGRAAAEEEGPGGKAAAVALEEYLRDPTPGVVLLFDCSRFDWEGDDKKKLERVRTFFSSVTEVVELRRATLAEARTEAAALARAAGLKLEREALDLLVESLAGDLARIAIEIEKLRLFGQREVNAGLMSAMTPDARESTVFALVNALGRKDRRQALQILDTLTREGEYLPLALSFLATQFRMALIAREAGLRSAGQIQGHFSKMGIPMWGSRAEAVMDTAQRFGREQLEQGMELIFQADRNLRSARPDDRTVMEEFVFALTAQRLGR